MAEYIDREAAEKVAERYGCTYGAALGRHSGLADCIASEIEALPAGDVSPVRHGRWIKRGYACGENEYECSVCHETEWRTSASRMKYCMFCGARMDGGESNG